MIDREKITISRWERGTRYITTDQMKKIADVLQCTLYELLFCDPKKSH